MAPRAPLRVQDIDLTDFELFVQGKAHDAWRLLRAEAPVHWNAGTAVFPGFWSVTTYADVLAVSRDTTTYSSQRGISMMVDPDHPTPASGAGKMLITMDPPHWTFAISPSISLLSQTIMPRSRCVPHDPVRIPTGLRWLTM